MDLLSLSSALSFLAAGGAAILAYWLLEHMDWLAALNPEQKRYAVYGLTAGLAVVFWTLKIVMLYEPAPVDVRAWVESMYGVAAGAIIGNQLLHARLAMKKNPEQY